MNNFFSELKRRNVVRVAVAYAVVSWVVLQFVDVISEIVNFPDQFAQMILVILIIFFPISLIISWAYEVTPEGVMKTKEVDKSKSVTHGTGGKLNKLIVGGLVLAIGFLLYDKFILGPDIQVIDAANAEAMSIAVLPFADLSQNGDQEYFSDGITEEILNVLVKVPGLKVAGRTSSFAFKGRNEDLRDIGDQLNVSFIVEGSVRKSGNRLRITAQLIRSDDGFHLWSETYDRELTEIFQIQDEISRAIAEALSVSLGLEQINLVPNQTDDLVAYEEYLKALSLFKARGPGLAEAIDLLVTVTLRDPNFVSGWELLAKVYSVYPFYAPNNGLNEVWDRYLTLAELAANKALALDPSSAIAHSSLGSVYSGRRQWQKSFEYHQKALDLDPKSGDIHQQYAEVLADVGRDKKALELARQAAVLEPLSAIILNIYGGALLNNGEVEEGIAVLKRSNALAPDLYFPVNNLMFYFVNQGQFEDAYEMAQLANQQAQKPYFEALIVLTGMLKDGAAEEEMWAFVGNNGQFNLIGPMLNSALQNADVLINNIKVFNYDAFEYSAPILMNGTNKFYWGHPLFKDLVRRSGLYDYWKTTGNWADDCKPVGEDDFECTP